MELIQRDDYLKKLLMFKDKQLIKVITGIRRCGKSTLMKLYQEYLLENGVGKEQIQYINFEDIYNEELLDYRRLHRRILEKALPDRKNYVFLDEIQNVPQFQKAADSLFIRENIDLYLTGSNAQLLSGELATLLSGRYVEIKTMPLSFREYISADKDANLQKKYSQYAEEGSFPYSMQIESRQGRADYLKGILDSIIIKDVLARGGIGNAQELYRIIRFLADNIGSLVSVKKISDTMSSAGTRITSKTAEKYISALMESFVFYQAMRYDIKGRQYLQTGSKYYIADTGLRHALLNGKSTDTGRILENIVYLELLRRGYNVFVGKAGENEIDFVAINNNVTEYYQVCQSVLSEETLNRELKPLSAIKDNYPKFLLTMDYLPAADYDGIRHINVLEWLAGSIY